MSKTVAGRMEYVVDFNDAALYRGIPKAHAAFQAFARQQQTSHRSAGTAAAESSDTVTRSMNRATQAIEQHGAKTKSILEMITWRLKYTAISAVTYAGMAGIGAFTAALIAGTHAGIQYNAMMEQSTIAYTTMLGSMSEATNLLGKLFSMATKSPFTFSDFVMGTQRLMAYGVEAKDLLRTLKAIGDATAAVGGSTDVFSRMSFSIGQMVSQGKITAREMRELAMAGVPAWDVLSKAIGKTVAETQKLSETVGIAASIGIPALLEGIEQRFGGMMEKMVDTWTGTVTTLKDNIKQMAGIAQEGVFAGLKEELQGLRDWTAALNAEAKQVGFMRALKEQSPEAYEALRVLQVNLVAVADAFKFVGSVVKPVLGLWNPLVAQFALGAVVITKMLPALGALSMRLLHLHKVSHLRILFQDFSATLANVRSGAMTAGQGVMLLGNSVVKTIGWMGLAGAAVAALGVGYVAYKKHLTEAKAAQDAVTEGAKTLATSMGGEWINIQEQVTGAAAAVTTFADKNREVIKQLREMSAAQQTGLLLGYAVEMQAREMDAETVQRNLDALVSAAGLTLRVPVGIDMNATGDLITEQAANLAAELEGSAGTKVSSAFKSFGLSIFSSKFGHWELKDSAKLIVGAWAQALDAEAASGNWVNAIATLAGVQGQETVLSELAQQFGELRGIVGLASGEFEDFDDVLTTIHESGVHESVRKMIETYRQAIDIGYDNATALALAEHVYNEATAAVNAHTSALRSGADAYEDLKQAAEEAAKVWAKELAAQYDLSSAVSNAIRVRQEALNEDAERQNDINRKAAEAERDSVDARAEAAIAAIERVRDRRLADLQEQEDVYQKQKSAAQGMGDVLGVKIAEDRIKALGDQKQAAQDAADAEKDAVRERAAAEKEAIETVKVSAEEARLSLDDITAALANAAAEADEYFRNLALLPQDIQNAIRDSGLTPEQKQQLAEELIVGSQRDRERAFQILRDVAQRRSDEAAAQWGVYGATMSAVAAEKGQDIVDALVGKLTAGGGDVFAAVGNYTASIARALNPILEALGEKSIPIVDSMGRLPGTQFAFARGGFLPQDATIQRPVGSRGLVQWAEPETKGEAFIPLAPEKRRRSIPIWMQTGRMLGVFAGGGFLSPWEGMESPGVIPGGLIPPTLMAVFGDRRLSFPHSGNVSNQGIYDVASAWMRSPTAAGVSYGSGGSGFAGMVMTAAAVWQAVQAYDAAAKFMGGRANRPYKSDHTTGHAFDFGGSASQMAAAAAWLAMTNPNDDVKYIIHNPLGIWKPTTGWRPYVPSKSVLAYAGDSAWHRDHVHVSTYDEGGILPPGLTLAYNGTGRPESIFADGGFSAFTGGTGTLTYGAEQATSHDKLLAEYERAAAAAKTYAAALAALAAQGSDAGEQLRAMGEQMAAVAAQRESAREILNLAEAAGATDEQMADLRVTVYGLEEQLASLASQARAIERIPLEAALGLWAAGAQQLTTVLGALRMAGGSVADQLKVFPSLMASLGAQYQTYLDLMDMAVSPEEIMQYGGQAIGILSSMLSASQEQLQQALDGTTEGVRREQGEWERAWGDRGDALEAEHNRQMEHLTGQADLYSEALQQIDAEIASLREGWSLEDQAASLANVKRDLANIVAQGYYTEADVRRMDELAERRDSLVKEAQRDAQIAALEREKLALQAQQYLADQEIEAKRQALEEQYRLQVEAAEREREEQAAEFERRISAAEEQYAKEMETLALKYAGMMQEVVAQEQALLAEAPNYHNAGLALGEAFAAGLLASISSVQAAAQAVAQAASDHLELHSPARKGPLAHLDQWWKAFPDTLLKPLDGPGMVDAAVGASVSGGYFDVSKLGRGTAGGPIDASALSQWLFETKRSETMWAEYDAWLSDTSNSGNLNWQNVRAVEDLKAKYPNAMRIRLDRYDLDPVSGLGTFTWLINDLDQPGKAIRESYSLQYQPSGGAPYSFQYDSGGWLMPGTTVAQNNTGKPELVTPWDDLLQGKLAAQVGAYAPQGFGQQTPVETMHVHEVRLSGDEANERHLPELARLVAREIDADIRNMTFSPGRR